MQMLTGISLICVLCVGYTYAQEEEFLGLLDFDTFGPDLKNVDPFADVDKEEAELKHYDRITVEDLKKLCDTYDIFLDDRSIDCNQLRLIRHALKVDHSLRKRAAEDPPLEGSGDGEGENPVPEYNPLSEGEIPPSGPRDLSLPEEDLPKKDDPPLPPNEEKKYPPSPPPEVNLGEVSPPPSGPSELPPPEGDLPGEGDVPPPPPEEAQKEIGGTQAPELPSIEPPTTDNDQIAYDPVFNSGIEGELPSTPKTELDPFVDGGGIPSEPPAKEEEPGPAENVTPTAEVPVAVVKKGRILRPDKTDAGTAEEPVKESETGKTQANELGEEKPKEPELIHEHQSGNAVVDGVDGGTIHQDEGKIRSMATNANIKAKSSDSNGPKSGESTEEPQQARKDTKVLIILFVAVVVVGAAAFAYNFIKKRKQKKDQTESREENGDGNVLKRSLQNLSGQTKGDPEQGTELKPLMKDGEKPVVEYKDEKESAKVVEGSK